MVGGVPEAFRSGVLAREGPDAQSWLDDLPALVGRLVGHWGCVLDGAVRHGGVGLVVPVRRPSDGAGVVKVSFPHPGNVHEPDAYRVWNGDGAVALRERDDDRFAMLLERAHVDTLADDAIVTGAADRRDRDRTVEIIGGLVGRLAVPAPALLPRLSCRAEVWLADLHRDAAEFRGVLLPRVVAAAAAVIEDIGRDQPERVVHGDLHAGNVLRSDREPWLAVDPKGWCGDPGYDVGALLRSHMWRHRTERDLPARARRTVVEFADTAGLDRERVRCWAVLHAAWAALWGARHGHRVARGGVARVDAVGLAASLAAALASPERG